jgi:hypothetical protein
VADRDAPQVFVDDHGRDVESVEKNGISGFWTYTGEGEELLTDCRRVENSGPMQRFDLAGVVRIEKGDEGLERGCLTQHETGRPDKNAEFGFGYFSQASDGKDAACFEIGDGTLDTFPGGVLGEVGADDDLECGFCGPPLLRAETSNETVVHDTEPSGRIARRDDRRAFRRVRSVMFQRHEFDLRISRCLEESLGGG